MSQATISLRLIFDATSFTPHTEITYELANSTSQVPSVRLLIGDRESITTVSNSLLELAYRYCDKHVTRAELKIGDTVYVDANGDGWIDLKDGQPTSDRLNCYDAVRVACGTSVGDESPGVRQPLYPIVPQLSGSKAQKQSFRASCGSLASVVHELKNHSLLWASIPPNGHPNEVHRHLGGNVYCIFYSGIGRFHRVDPASGFETVQIAIDGSNPFDMITIPIHMWYQPINVGPESLLYFMVHEPAFETSEMLSLEQHECMSDLGFEF